MSDSDDEAAFESADEGDVPGPSVTEPSKSSPDVKSVVEKQTVGAEKQETYTEGPALPENATCVDDAESTTCVHSPPTESAVKPKEKVVSNTNEKKSDNHKKRKNNRKGKKKQGESVVGIPQIAQTRSVDENSTVETVTVSHTETCSTTSEGLYITCKDDDTSTSKEGDETHADDSTCPGTVIPDSEQDDAHKTEVETKCKQVPECESEANEFDSTGEASSKECLSTKGESEGGIMETQQKAEDGEKEHGQENKISSVLSRLSGAADQKPSGWSTWGSWGTSILSTAASSVQTFTSNVGEGIHTVMENVESSLADDIKENEEKEKTSANSKIEVATKELKSSKNEENVIVKDGKYGWLSTIGDGLHNVMETVESAVGAPPPEQLARAAPLNETPEEKLNIDKETGGWLSNLKVDRLTKAVGSTGIRVVTGSLDALESFGKKTMDVINETDPGFQKTKRILKPSSKPNLSQTLREAKLESEETLKQQSEAVEARKASFGFLFDEYQGIAHLEALEILSNQCEIQVQSGLSALSAQKIKTVKSQLIILKEIFQLDDMEDSEGVEDHDFVTLVTEQFADLHLGSSNKVNKAQCKAREWIKDCQEEQEKGTRMSAKEIHEMSIQCMAELTALTVGQFHKTGELLLTTSDQVDAGLKSRATNLVSITKLLCTEVGILSNQFSECLNTAADDSEDPDSVNPLITSVYFEASNSCQYIQDAFQLLLPVFQSSMLQAKK